MMWVWILFATIFSHGGAPDLSLGFAGRTFPIAGQLEAIGGYGHVLWGDTGDLQASTPTATPQASNPWYGFVRPSLTVRGPTTPTGLVALDVFPVSFFGFTVGRSYMLRLVEQPEIDCSAAECLEWMKYTYAQVRGYAKWKNMFFTILYERTFYDSMDDLTRPLFQSNNAVMQDPSGDNGDEVFSNIGYEWNDQWSSGVTLQYFSPDISDNRQEMQIGFVRYFQNGWTWTVGAGRFYSSPLGTGLELVGMVSWDIQRRLGYR